MGRESAIKKALETDTPIDEVRDMLRSGATLQEIADTVGVDVSAISHLIRRHGLRVVRVVQRDLAPR